LIFEVTAGQTLPLPITNQQASIVNHQFFPPAGKTTPMELIGSIIPAQCKNPPCRPTPFPEIRLGHWPGLW
jgi:hypothetical protein